jgi:hypothetical protein
MKSTDVMLFGSIILLGMALIIPKLILVIGIPFIIIEVCIALYLWNRDRKNRK